jgi:quercetin 2,3-dioxygenase
MAYYLQALLHGYVEGMTSSEGRSRSVTKIINGVRTLEGAGFSVRRPFPTAAQDFFDPFLLLDEMGPTRIDAGGPAVGAPTHPHRGFETVTYLLEGGMRHKDSRGHSGKLGPGDVQWMTAGSGVLHDELPDEEFVQRGGTQHGFQLWVNLPRKDKWIEPRYQEFPAARIPTGISPDGKVEVKVIAGEALGARAVIETRTPIFYLHYTVAPGGQVSQPADKTFNTFATIIHGEGRFGPEQASAVEGQTVLFADDGGLVTFSNPGKQPLSLLLLGGVPLNEPVARYGPFVMNTEPEIAQAIRDFQGGKFGVISH